MPAAQATSQNIRKDIRTQLYRDEDYKSIDELFQYQQTQPYYQWREEEIVLGTSVVITNTAAFAENRSFQKRIKGRLVLPVGVEFAQPPLFTIVQGSQQLIWNQEPHELQLLEQDPNMVRFDLPNITGEPVAMIRIQCLHFAHAHRNPGLSIELEITFEEECFVGGIPGTYSKLITTSLLYQRSLGADNSGHALVPLMGDGGTVNIASGNHHLPIPLFASVGKGISTNLSLHYNHWNTSHRLAVDSLLFFNEDNGYDFEVMFQNYGSNTLGFGWNHNYEMHLFPYALPIEPGSTETAIAHLEIRTADGNRIQFIESDQAGIFEPQYLSDAWEGNANLLLSMRVKREGEGWVASGLDLIEYRFDKSGRLIEISSVLTRNSEGSLNPLKVEYLGTPGDPSSTTLITDSAGRVTKIEHPQLFGLIEITNAADQVFKLFLSSKTRRTRVRRENTFGAFGGLNGATLLTKIEFPENLSRAFEYDFRTCYLNRSRINKASSLSITHFTNGNTFRFPDMEKSVQLDFWGFPGKVQYGSRLCKLVYSNRNQNRQRMVYHQPPPVDEDFTSETHFGYHPATQSVREISTVYPVKQANGNRVRTETLLSEIDYYEDRSRNADTRLVNIETGTDGAKVNFNYRRSRRFPGSFLLTSKVEETFKGGEKFTTKYKYHQSEELHRVIDPNNNVTLYTYDSRRLLLRITYPKLKGQTGRATESWLYHPNGQPKQHVNKRRFFTLYQFGGTATHEGKALELDPFNLGLPTGEQDFTSKLVAHKAYNVFGLEEKSFNPLYGGWNETEYDGLNRSIKSIGPALKNTLENLPKRHISTIEYNDNGTVKETTDNFGNRTSFTYSSLLELSSTTDVFKHTTEILKRNGQGAILESSDPKGHVTTAEYDDHLGRITRELSPEPVNPDGKRIETTKIYFDFSNKELSESGTSKVLTLKDSLGRVTLIQEIHKTEGTERSRHLIRKIEYPNKGFSIREKVLEGLPDSSGLPIRQLIERELDEWGRETSYSFGLEVKGKKRMATTVTKYDFDDNVIEELPPIPDTGAPVFTENNRPRHRFEYDSLGRKTATIDSFNVVKVLRQYVDARTEDGQAATIDFTHGNESPNQKPITTAFANPQFPTVAREVKMFNTLGQVEQIFDFFSIDAIQPQAENRIVRRKPRLQSIDVSKLEKPVSQQLYTARKEVLQTIDSEGVSRLFRYNAKGFKTDEFLETESFPFTQSTLNTIRGIPNSIEDTSPKLDLKDAEVFTNATKPIIHEFSFAYDENDNLISTTEPSGKVYTKTYDELNRLLTDSHPHNGRLPQSKIAYDNKGRPQTLQHEKGLKIEWQYLDADNTALALILHPGFEGGSGQEATLIEAFEWDGSLKERRDSRQRLRCNYSYDELRFLQKESHADFRGEEQYSLRYDHDTAGNRRRMQLKIAKSKVDLNLTYEYDQNFQLIGIRQLGVEANNNGLTSLMKFSYAKSGLPTSVYRSNGVSTHYRFDEIGRPVRVLDFKSTSIVIGGRFKLPIQLSTRQKSIADQSYFYQPVSEGRRLIRSSISLENPDSSPNVPLFHKTSDQFYQYRSDGRLKAQVKEVVSTFFSSCGRINDISAPLSLPQLQSLENGLQVSIPPDFGKLIQLDSRQYREFVYDDAGRDVFQINGAIVPEGESFKREIFTINATEFDDKNNTRNLFQFQALSSPGTFSSSSPFLSIENKGGLVEELDLRNPTPFQKENLLDEQGRVWLERSQVLTKGAEAGIIEHGYAPYGGLSLQSRHFAEGKDDLQFRIYDGQSLLAVLDGNFQLVEFNITEPGSNVRLARVAENGLEFTHTDVQYQPLMLTQQEARKPIITESDFEPSTIENIKLNTIDFIVGWGDAFTAGWTTRVNRYYGNEWTPYNEDTYNKGWWFGLGSSIALGVLGGGAFGKALAAGTRLWAPISIGVYSQAMNVDAVSKSTYALYSGNFHWSDAFGFLPAIGWGTSARRSFLKWKHSTRLILGKDVNTLNNAKKLIPEPGMYQLVVHGSYTAFIIDGVEHTAEQVATRMLLNGYKIGTPIHCISCYSGSDKYTGVAARLSKVLNVPVYAPSSAVTGVTWIDYYSKLTTFRKEYKFYQFKTYAYYLQAFADRPKSLSWFKFFVKHEGGFELMTPD